MRYTLDSTQSCGFELNVNTASCPQRSKGLSVSTARQIRRALPKIPDSDAMAVWWAKNNSRARVSGRSKLSLALHTCWPDIWPHYCRPLPKTQEWLAFDFSGSGTQRCLLANQSQPAASSSLLGLGRQHLHRVWKGEVSQSEAGTASVTVH